MVNIVNYSTTSIGGFRHYSGLLPAVPGDGASQAQASVRYFHVPAANAVATYRGDIMVAAQAAPNAIGTPGGADLPSNIAAPGSLVIGNGGGSGLGNQSIAPNAIRFVVGDTTSIILGVVVGFGFTLYTAKNGFQYSPASTEQWVAVETDPQIEMYITVPTVPGTAFNLNLMGGATVQENAGQQISRFGVSGLSLSATFATTSTLPLRVLGSGEQIGDDPTAAGFVAKVMFNQNRHYKGGGVLVLD